MPPYAHTLPDNPDRDTWEPLHGHEQAVAQLAARFSSRIESTKPICPQVFPSIGASESCWYNEFINVHGNSLSKATIMTGFVHETPTDYKKSSVPQLNSGDILDHDEYIRRYEAAPDKLKAERINGRVYLMNALRAVAHGDPHSVLNLWLGTFAMHDPNLVVSDNATVFLGAEHEPQPDLCLRLSEGGTTYVDDDGYLVGPPEMIVEIAGSSASYDFGEKRGVYEAAGVGEYLVFETIEGRIEWWRHDGTRFVDVPRDGMLYKSVRFSGLWLDGDALRSADRFRLIETLQRGIAST